MQPATSRKKRSNITNTHPGVALGSGRQQPVHVACQAAQVRIRSVPGALQLLCIVLHVSQLALQGFLLRAKVIQRLGRGLFGGCLLAYWMGV